MRKITTTTLIILIATSVFHLAPKIVHAFTIARPTNYLTLNADLIGYWTFDGKHMVSKVEDISGQGNSAYLVGQSATTTVIGKIGQALEFDGVNDLVRGNQTITMGPNGTISWWQYSRSAYNTGTVRAYWQINNASHDLTCQVYSTNSWYCGVYSGSDYRYTTPAVQGTNYFRNVWTHYALVYSPSDDIFYVNGNRIGSRGSMTNIGTSAFTFSIGGFHTSAVYLDGYLDDFRVYNRSLSDGEVRSLYGAGASKVASSPTSIFKDGLVSYYTFDGKNMISNVADISGQGNTGYTTGFTATTTVIGKIGQALQFDGTDDYIQTAGNIAWGSGAKSMSFWLYLNGLPAADYAVPLSLGAAASTQIFEPLITTTGVMTMHSWGFQSGTVTTLVPGRWYHIAMTYNGTTAKAYINGRRSGSDWTTTLATATGKLRVGRTHGNGFGTRYINGILDDVRVYNRELSANEVLQLYEVGG